VTAILFGSTSTLADTSEVQRASFNEAFAVHQLGWSWSRQDSQEILDAGCSTDRVAFHARPAVSTSMQMPRTGPNLRFCYVRLLLRTCAFQTTRSTPSPAPRRLVSP